MDYRVYLDIPASDFQRYYRGDIRQVIATLDDGRRIQFPANVLRQVITREGLTGWFVLATNEEGVFVSIRRMS